METPITNPTTLTEALTINGWVARDKSDKLYIYGKKPVKDDEFGIWLNDFDDHLSFIELDKAHLPEITWETEPVEVELTIKLKEK